MRISDWSSDVCSSDLTWNDPAIAAVNPGVELPASKINLVQRSVGSGTTFNFTNYLTKVSPAWKDAVGEGKSVQWPDGVGGKGNEGVASYVKKYDGTIGYVDQASALPNTRVYARERHAAPHYVDMRAETLRATPSSDQ